MFESDFIERFSRVHPISFLVVYIPIVLYFWYRSVTHGLPLGSLPGLVLVGWLIWSISEYVLHRWVFHWVGSSRAGRRFHFLLHGVHHEFPQDKDRLVMPLGFSLPVGSLFYLGIVAVFGLRLADPIFSGFAIGYLLYDGTHYAVHHFKMTSAVGRAIKKHHMMHHHQDHSGGFGVSTPLWDLVFRTMPKPKGRPKSSTLL
jgi:sterol desaturase/sphingolipid hydroxylase (fatty acid hydroxylase superfamily)